MSGAVPLETLPPSMPFICQPLQEIEIAGRKVGLGMARCYSLKTVPHRCEITLTEHKVVLGAWPKR